MSMLAERKRKQKWSLNPRGKAWSEDGTKFGQKLLEKMGWQTGKGLGAKEDGITEHVKLAYKNDSKGMGYKETDQWTEHESNFTALLESLTGTAADTDMENVKLNSLEKKSRVSRVRLHYHKFTKGKDLSSRSEKDLANIFGRKTLKRVEKKGEEDVPEKGDEMEGNGMLINGGSMADYFKNKLPSFGRSLKKAESESEDELRIGFGFKSSSEDKPGFKRKLEEDSANIFSPKKKVKGDNGFVNPGFNPLNNRVLVEKHSLETILESSLENVNIEETESNIDLTVEIHNKPKKKKLNSSEHLEPVNTPNLSQFEVKLSSKKKKKLKTALVNPNCTDQLKKLNSSEQLETSVNTPNLSQFEVKLSSKTKKKLKTASVNPNCDQLKELNSSEHLETSVNTPNLSQFEVKLSSKTKKKLKTVSVNPNCTDHTDQLKKLNSSEQLETFANTPNLSQFEVKLSSKKKKKLKTASVNPSCTDHTDQLGESIEHLEQLEETNKKKSTGLKNPSLENEPGLKKKKNKKGKSSGVDNPNFEDYNLSQNGMENHTFQGYNTSQNDLEVVRSGKSIKNKRKNLENGIENPNFEDYVLNSPQEDSEVVQNRKQKRKSGIENPNFEDNVLNSSQADPDIVQNGKSTKRKRKNLQNGIENPNFEDHILNSSQEGVHKENPTKYKHKNLQNGIENPMFKDRARNELKNSPEMIQNVKFRKSKKHNNGIQNPNFTDYSDTSLNISDVNEDIKSKKKKKKTASEVVNDKTIEETPESAVVVTKIKSKKKINGGIDNITFEQHDQCETIIPEDNPYEVKLKNKKKQSKPDDPIEEPPISSDNIDYSDLMLNIVTTPVIPTPQPSPKLHQTDPSNSAKRRKSVRFNDVPQRHIIPNNEQLKLMEGGIDNVNFNEAEVHLQENMERISDTIDRFQAEIENDINEKKSEEIMIGEMDRPDGPNEKLPDGTRLKFRFVEFDRKFPNYFAANTGPKKSYKHLIKGDIILKFKNTNLHEVNGYAARKIPKSRV